MSIDEITKKDFEAYEREIQQWRSVVDFQAYEREIQQWRSGVVEIIKALGGEPPEIVSLNKVCELAADLRARLEQADKDRDELEWKLLAADGMAKVADDWVERKLIDTRSALADARLNYGDPYKYKSKKQAELAAAKVAGMEAALEVAESSTRPREDIRALINAEKAKP